MDTQQIQTCGQMLFDYDVQGLILDPFDVTGQVHNLHTEFNLTIGVRDERYGTENPGSIVGSVFDLGVLGFDPESVVAVVGKVDNQTLITPSLVDWTTVWKQVVWVLMDRGWLLLKLDTDMSPWHRAKLKLFGIEWFGEDDGVWLGRIDKSKSKGVT